MNKLYQSYYSFSELIILELNVRHDREKNSLNPYCTYENTENMGWCDHGPTVAQVRANLGLLTHSQISVN